MKITTVKLGALASAITASLVWTAPLGAETEVEIARVDAGHIPAAQVVTGAQAVELVDFDYDAFFDRATQLGLLSQRLGYTLTVGLDGKPVDCALSRNFRNSFTAKELCKKLKASAMFSPARDQAGNAVVAVYVGEVRIWSVFASDR
ncbi:MAG: hypothetical protein EAY70_10735 [Sphingomonadales bacterium]|nr:MAG: hypothetical protein EAY70_10735 [Sphingomonadales bacterium]